MFERIHKVISAHGAFSRREAERMILAGRITVDGLPAKIGQSVEFGQSEIAIDGVPLAQKDKFVYVMLNKPRGYVTTMNDEKGRKTVKSLVSEIGVHIYPVGRLDMDSEGLLFMTNDGKFANSIMHPSFSVPKTYEAHVTGNINAALPGLKRPMEIDSHSVEAVSARILKKTGNGGIISITISEGRNRQIRKMCALCGLEVRMLRRVSIGSVNLGALEPGQWRHLTEDELLSLAEPNLNDAG